MNRYRSTLPSPHLQHILDIILRPVSTLDEKSFLTYLKEVGVLTLSYLTTTAKHIEYRFFCELQNLSGYDTILHQQFDMKTDTLPFTQKEDHDDDLPIDLLNNVKKVIDNLGIKKIEHLISQFVSNRDNISADGTASIHKPAIFQYYKSGKQVQIDTKFFSLLQFSDNDIVFNALNTITTICKAFLKKDEASKARVVIAYCLWSYIRCSYLESFINLDGIDIWSTLGADPRKKQYTRSCINDAIKRGQYLLCVDQSAFDQHQPRSLILYALRYLFKRIVDVNPQAQVVVDAELRSLDNVWLIVDPQTGEKRPWARGLLSGYKFTALLGSILNQAEFLTVCDRCGYSPSGGFYQGDDAVSWFSSPIDKDKICCEYTKLGFLVNPLKTWYSDKATEFLREIYFEDNTYGVPSRCALSLIFSKPKPHKPQPDHWFVRNINTILKAKRRGLEVDQLGLDYTYKYLKEHYHVSPLPRNLKILCYYYLATPAAFGGVGLYPYNPKYPLVCLSRFVSEEKNAKKTVQIISPVKYQPIPDMNDYILKQVKDRIQISSTKTGYLLTTIPKDIYKHHSPYTHNSNTSRHYPSPPPTTWIYPADERAASYYKNKLSFSLHQDPLPPEARGYDRRNYLSYCRFYNSLYSFDDFVSNQEIHLHMVAQLKNSVNRLAFLILRGYVSLTLATKFIYSFIYSYYKYLYTNNYYTLKPSKTIFGHNTRNLVFCRT